MSFRDPAQGELTSIFLRMGELLVSDETIQSALDLVCSLAAATLPGTLGAGVTLIKEGKKSTAAYSDEIVKRADALQYELDEGPCLAAWKQKATIRIDSMETERRWPKWCPAAAAMGMGSALSVPLLVREEPRGAIKVYSGSPHSYDEYGEQILWMFGQQAAAVLANVQAYAEAQQIGQQLKEALQNRDIIGEAKGILMERETIDDERAFAILREISQRRNAKLRDVARKIVEEKLKQANLRD